MGRGHKGVWAAVAAAVLLAVTQQTCFADSASEREYKIKAACLIKFLRFMTFPAEASDADAPLRICIVGDGAAAEIMADELYGSSVGGRVIEVDRASSLSELGESGAKYHLLFTTGGDSVSNLQSHAYIVVGDSVEFCRSGGTISIRVESNRIRFDINPKAARVENVKISSQLLKLATVVTGVTATAAAGE